MSTTIRFVAGFAAACLVVVAIVLSNRPTHNLRDVIAARAWRVGDARLSGGLAWTPVKAPERGANDRRDPDLDIAIAALEIAWRDSGSASSLGTAALGKLVAGETDAAITDLEDAAEIEPSATMLSDLAAAYLTRGVHMGRGVDLLNGLELSTRAVATDSAFVEARFNRAVALGLLGLQTQAEAAWREHIQREPDPAWKREAVDRLDMLTSGADRVDAQALREEILDDLLPQLGASPGNRARLDQTLARLMAANPDASFTAIVTSAARDSDHTGYQLYGEAKTHYRRTEYARAKVKFTEAHKRLSVANPALAQWAGLYLATIDYLDNNLQAASARLIRLDKETSNAPTLRGHIDWVRGMIAVLEGRPSDAFELYERSASALSQSGEHANAAFVRGMIAEEHEWLSEPGLAWDARLAALREAPRSGALLSAAASAREMGWLHAALAINQEALELARKRRRLPDVVDALRQLALTETALGRTSAAATALQEAGTTLEATDAGVRERLRGELELSIAACGCLAPGRTIEAGTFAIAHFGRANAPTRLPAAYLARAKAYRRIGQPGAARADLETGIDMLEVEAGRARLPDAMRAVLGGELRRFSDAMVDLELAQGDARAALAASDRGRARNLPDGSTPPLGPAGIQKLVDALPADVSIAYQHQQDEALLVWVLARGAVSFMKAPIGAREVKRLARQLARRPDDATAAAAARRLLPSVIDRPRLIIVADGGSNAVPFASLPGSRSRYLLEEVELSYAPGLRWLTEAIGASGRSRARISAIANPSFDREAFPSLPQLRGADAEAGDVASYYPARRIVSGAIATKEALLTALRESDVVHFAGHAVVDDLEPSNSRLVLAGRGGSLTARAIAQLSDVRAELVVLAACNAASGYITKAEGPIGLTRAFLSAGVSSVVASLWPVDDEASRALFDAFHREFTRSGNVAAALRQGQLALAKGPDRRLHHPSHWAGFIAVTAEGRLNAQR